MASNQTSWRTDNYADNQTESLEHLNARYAEALLPLTITFGFFTVLGFLGNGLILLVFSLSRDYKRNNFKVFVLTLGVIDLVTCVTLIPAEMVKQRHYFEFSDALPCKVKCFFNVFGASASCLALLVISVDRYRKVVQPFKKQLNPTLAVKILAVVAFVFPVILAIPGTVMCGIKTTNMTNIHNGNTTIQLCETEERFMNSIWRAIYKWVFIILLFGVSLTYIVLYAFVMREAAKQIRSMALQRKNSSFDVSYSSGIYDPNAVVHEPLDVSNRTSKDIRASLKPPEEENLQDNSKHSPTNSYSNYSNNKYSANGSLRRSELKHKKVSKQFSLRSLRSHTPMLHRQGFPTKTIIWFILTIVFIISYMTHILLALKVGDIVYMSPEQFSSFSFFFRIYFFNHMINPLVYAVFVKRFRESCKQLCPTLKTRILKCFT